MSADRVQRELVRETAMFLQTALNEHRRKDTYDNTPAIEWDQMSYAQRRIMQHAAQDLLFHFALIAHKVEL